MVIYAGISLQASVYATLHCFLVKIASACGSQSIIEILPASNQQAGHR